MWQEVRLPGLRAVFEDGCATGADPAPHECGTGAACPPGHQQVRRCPAAVSPGDDRRTLRAGSKNG